MQNSNLKFKEEFKKRLYKLTLELIKFIESLDSSLVSKRMADQLLRIGTSVIANYVEGLAGSSKRDFAKFINIALKSSNESKLWLSLLKDSNKSNVDETNMLIKEFDEISKILASSLITIRKSLK
ncbi:MAG: four helix bundle protein [Ignavibacteriales bacterium]|nr:four helix bundle protein [Ignavibacteriales bacterium]